jgi:copper homeostasis protein
MPVPPGVLFEAVVTDVAGARAAVAHGGAARLELCVRLDVGGITPPRELVRAVVAAAPVPVHAMVRPRGGDFVHDAAELDAMVASIGAHRDAGARGVVFGALTRDHAIDRAATTRLVAAARPMAVTFHRAFDDTPDLDAALDTLIELGVERVLTSGGMPTAPAAVDVLARLVRRAAGRITVLAGGGVRPQDYAALVARAGVRELHASRW